MNQISYFKNRVESTYSPMDYMMKKKEQPENYLLIDVRNGDPALKREKIQGALEIPLSDLESRLNEIPKDKEIVLYCWDVWCNTAAKASIMLIENGYSVKELNGGIAAWKTMGFPLVSLLNNEQSNCGC
ncbi:ArsR family transcriptional regulator [Lysinibacillus sp. FJAT-14745]|uniref:rhodanese-like domain-containing protein n=1 Tax=Lysinibacillus sp. FJAT-14745 TaxID=1704289 RepID=UPI0006ABD185|nr:rhodanese-like domain-containing protein [Lysinibacillus sp. FJAT-14745]KOP79277.1 ArsR family transcriptional regulator [Lysinibacillus sp. FJAT-14745]